jgi:hypothetical protein
MVGCRKLVRQVNDRRETWLEMARRHVSEGESRIVLQISIIATLEEGNHTESAALSRRVLETMRTSLDMAKRDLTRIESQSKR